MSAEIYHLCEMKVVLTVTCLELIEVSVNNHFSRGKKCALVIHFFHDVADQQGGGGGAGRVLDPAD